MTYSIEQDRATDRWLIVLDGRPIGAGLVSFSNEVKATLMKTALEDAFEAGKSQAKRETADLLFSSPIPTRA